MQSYYPWHTRRATLEHYLRYRNLVELHHLTHSWIEEMNLSRELPLARGVPSHVMENLWMLEKLSASAPLSTVTEPESLDQLLDDTTPDDLLGRLEHTVLAVQVWTLMYLLKDLNAEKKATLKNQLEQISWKAGRDCAQARWPTLGSETRTDLRGIFSALQDSPFSDNPHRKGFLIRRASAKDIRLDWLSCPHKSHHSEVKNLANELCPLYLQWIRGFGYAMNTTFLQAHQQVMLQGEHRCHLDWSFASL